MKRALITGSFDPPTRGHLDLIERTHTLFDEVIVCLSSNSEKKYFFDLSTRFSMLKECCLPYTNVQVDVWDGLVAEYAKKHKITAIVRGVRSGADFEYECMVDEGNRLIYPVETLFLPSRSEFRYLSSTVAREMIRYHQDLSKVLPPEVISILNIKNNI